MSLPKLVDKYTLFDRGVEVISCNNLPWLERGLCTLTPTRGTYIRFNETGVNQYVDDQRWDDQHKLKGN